MKIFLLHSQLLSLLLVVLMTKLHFVVGQLPAKVSIVHINDHHSHMDELNLDIGRAAIPSPIVPSNIRIKYGSFPRVVSLIKQMSTQATTAGFDVVKLHAGDAVTGTPYFSYFGSNVDATVLNLAGLDAMTIGNHEFDRGDEFLSRFISNLTFPVLSANVVPHSKSGLIKNGKNVFLPYIVKRLTSGEKIGICGITTKAKTELSSFPDPGTTLVSETVAATECSKNLTMMGINKIVLLTHIGFADDLLLMSKIPNVDIVVGGDSHTLLGTTTSFMGTNILPQGQYATISNGVCIVHAWEYGKAVGRLDVTFNAAGNVTSCIGSPQIPFSSNNYQVLGVNGKVFLNSSDSKVLTNALLSRGIYANVSEDVAVAAALAPFRNSLVETSRRVLGFANTSLCHSRNQDSDPICPMRDLTSCLGGALCNMVARGYFFNVPNADFAIQNSGGCQSDIQQGNITFSHLYEVLPAAIPDENTLVTLRLTGSQIKMVLEEAAESFLNSSVGGRIGSYPFAAGLRWRVEYGTAFPNRFTNVEMNKRLEQGAWSPLDLSRYYTVVTSSLVASGRDGYLTFATISTSDKIDTFIEYGQSFVNYIESIDAPINEPPLSEFSSQRIAFLDGKVCDATAGISFPGALSARPSNRPSRRPGTRLTTRPSQRPGTGTRPSGRPRSRPTGGPISRRPSKRPSSSPSGRPSRRVTARPRGRPSKIPSANPSAHPSGSLSASPLLRPSALPIQLSSVPYESPLTNEGDCPTIVTCRKTGYVVSKKFLGFCVSLCVRRPRKFLARKWKCGRSCA